MTGAYATLGLVLVLGWCVWRLGRRWWPGVGGIAAGLIVAAAFVFLGGQASAVTMAVLAPLGAVLPALALRDMAAGAGHPSPRLPSVDLAVVGALHAVFLAAAMGAVRFDPYRFGYDPAWGSVFALCCIAYLAWRRQAVLAAAVLVGQALWIGDVGPSNMADHALHMLLVPIVLIVLLGRAVR